VSAALLARMRAQRQSWVELEPGLRVQILRPLEAEYQDFVTKPGSSELDRMLLCAEKFVTNWEGFTEAFLLGASQAAADPVTFDRGLWAEVMRDHTEWVVTVTRALMELLNAHNKEREDAAKN